MLHLQSGQAFCFGMATGQPPALLKAVADRLRAGDLQDLRLYYKIAMKHAAETVLAPEVLHLVHPNPMFLTAIDRKIIKDQIASGHKVLNYVPAYFYQIPRLFTEYIAIDTFAVTVSPMDKHGYFSLGTNNDYASTVLRNCKRSVVEVNKHMPRVFGESLVHISEVDAVVEFDAPLLDFPEHPSQPEDPAIGKLVSELVPDGATIQMGIGGIPNAVAQCLENHKDLGVHSELFVPGMMRLIQRGVITGKKKTLHKNKNVFTVALGTEEMYEFIDDNPSMESYPSSYCNHPSTIAKNDSMISINSAIEIDLYGQVNAETLDNHEFSGTGGALDFMRGAFDSRGGKSFIALYSTAKGGTISRIVPRIDNLITDPRMDTEFVVTEYGVANLKGKSTSERARALIDIAHPKFRDELTQQAKAVTLI